MAFEPNYEKLVTSSRKTLNTAQAEVDVKLSTVDGEIKSVLCSSAKAVVLHSEVNGNTINYNGTVNFQVIYESTNGEIVGLDYTAEFVDKYINENNANVFLPIVRAEVVDENVSVTSNTTMQANAIVEVSIDGIFNDSINALTAVTGDHAYTSMEQSNFFHFLGVMSDKYEFANDIEINEGISKVLSVTPSVSLEKVTLNNDFAMVSGNVFVDMCYLTNEEAPKARSYTTNLDFSFEIAFSGLNTSSYVQSDIFINSSDIRVTSNLDLDKAVINLVLPITYNGYVFEPHILDLVADVYSTTNELNITSSSVTSLLPRETLTTMDKINGSVMIEDSFVDEILGNCCNYVTVTSSFVEDDFVVVEGIASTTVLYFNKEENTKNSIIVEIPFSTRLKGENVEEGYVPIVSCVVSDILTKCKRGQEIEVFAKLYIYANTYTNATSAVISNITVGEEIAPSPCALKIYIVKEGESLWDVAKELNTSVDNILVQNPNLVLPLQGGERIYIYYQRAMEF